MAIERKALFKENIYLQIRIQTESKILLKSLGDIHKV